MAHIRQSQPDSGLGLSHCFWQEGGRVQGLLSLGIFVKEGREDGQEHRAVQKFLLVVARDLVEEGSESRTEEGRKGASHTQGGALRNSRLGASPHGLMHTLVPLVAAIAVASNGQDQAPGRRAFGVSAGGQGIGGGLRQGIGGGIGPRRNMGRSSGLAFMIQDVQWWDSTV